MKKKIYSRLLALAVFCPLLAVSLQVRAYGINENIYTRYDRYKIISNNLLTNGDFSNGLEGWATDGGSPLSTDTFMVSPTGGPQGGPALLVQTTGGAGMGGFIHRSLPCDAGKYYIVSYSVCSSVGDAKGLITYGSKNYQQVYADSTAAVSTTLSGNHFTAIAKTLPYTEQWTTVNYAYASLEDGYLNIDLADLPVGHQLANFGVYEATLLSDDRELQAVIDDMNALAQNSYFNNVPAREELAALALSLEEYRTEENKETLEGIVAAARGEEGIEGFLNANTVNVTGYITNADFEKNSLSGWTNSGGRWRVGSKTSNDTYYALAYYPIGYILGEHILMQSLNLPAGKYMFTADLAGNKYIAKNVYDTDYIVNDAYLFINGDTLNITDLPNEGMRPYTIYATVKEGEKVTFGAAVRANVAHNFYVDNCTLRLIDGEEQQVTDYIYATNLKESKNTLQEWTDSAQVLLDDARYFYGKADLTDSIATATRVQTESADLEEVNTATTWIKQGISRYVNLNDSYIQFCDDLAEGYALLDDENYKHGKETFRATVEVMDAYKGTLYVDSVDNAGLTAHHDGYVIARSAYYLANASYTTPGYVVLANPDFADAKKGWTLDACSGNAAWKSSASDIFAGGYRLIYSRGNTAKDSKYAWQDVELMNPGLYEYSAECIAHNTSEKKDLDNTGAFFFVGVGDQKIDSVQMHTQTRTTGLPEPYALRVIISEPTTLRIGIDARNNIRACVLGLGTNRLKYYGAYDQYVADSMAAVMAPMKDSLQVCIDAAQNLLASVRNPLQVDITPFANAIVAAQTAHQSEEFTVVKSAFEPLEAARRQFMLSGVYPAEDTCFDLTFCIQNSRFIQEPAFSGWSVVGDSASLLTDGGITQLFQATDRANYRTMQLLNGLPEGDYKLQAQATYRWGLIGSNENYNFADYEVNHPMYLLAGNDSVAVRGLLDGYTDSLTVVNNLALSIYDLRHNTYATQVLRPEYLCVLPFNVGETHSATVGYSFVGVVRNNSSFRLMGFSLHYYGALADGIEGTVADELVVTKGSEAVYDLFGRRINGDRLQKGIYILNGKKRIVK